MAARGVLLTTTSALVTVVADQAPVQWGGGKTSFCIVASTYPTTCKLQLLGGDGTTWLDVNGTTVSANAVPVAYDLPAGTYRLHLASGTVADLAASLVSIPYI